MKPNTPLLFRKTPNVRSLPNASFLREMGIVGGEMAVEIAYEGQKWIVRESDFLGYDEAMRLIAQKIKNEITLAETEALPEKTKAAVSRRLKMSPRTLDRRREFIKIWLP